MPSLATPCGPYDPGQPMPLALWPARHRASSSTGGSGGRCDAAAQPHSRGRAQWCDGGPRRRGETNKRPTGFWSSQRPRWSRQQIHIGTLTWSSVDSDRPGLVGRIPWPLVGAGHFELLARTRTGGPARSPCQRGRSCSGVSVLVTSPRVRHGRGGARGWVVACTISARRLVHRVPQPSPSA
eukprot:scaffold50_cov420-Prasinococcus_capsulatus_cf.AAC.6